MRSSYRKLGEFIEIVDQRNKDLEVDLLLGVSIKKILIPSIANTVGTKMRTYKIITKGQFVYGPVTSRNGDKMSIALLNDNDQAIVSQSYTVFKVADTTKLDPEYLMMWFRRPEFDRYARYMSHGSTRETFSWDEMCDIELPVPSPEKQREIVAEYKTVTDRIELNEKLNEKLEETAQAVYREWFVEFNFPMTAEQAKELGDPELEGKPYRDNGGKMIWNEELEKDVPEGWEVKELGEVTNITSSKRIYSHEYKDAGIPFYRGKEITLLKSGQIITEPIYISKKRFEEIKEKFGSVATGDILITAVGTIGSVYLVKDNKFYFKDGNIIWLKDFTMNFVNQYIFEFMNSIEFSETIQDITIGSTQKAITIDDLQQVLLIFPFQELLQKYSNMRSTYTLKSNNHLLKLQNLLLSKMSKVGL